MATTEEPSPFLFLSANTPWVYALAEALGHEAPVRAVRFYDWQTYWRIRPDWPAPDPKADISRTLRVLPTGYAGTLEWAARPFMQWMIDGWRRALRERTGTEPYVVVPYPYLAPWVRNVPDKRLIYYNLDAYTRYRPERAHQIQENEAELVERAALTICLAQHQVEALRSRHPDRAEQIRHFPLGVVDSFLNPAPEEAPTDGTVTYVGNMSDRMDWSLVDAVTATCADLQFRFVGGVEKSKQNHAWQNARARVLGRANVEAVGRVPQDEVVSYYWASSVNWIPYDPEHPFNMASCPTKIMDGLASGRPLVSTPVPECTLYPEWIDLASTPDEMVEVLRSRARGFDAERGRRQVERVRKHTWPHRAAELRRLLGEKPSSSVSSKREDQPA